MNNCLAIVVKIVSLLFLILIGFRLNFSNFGFSNKNDSKKITDVKKNNIYSFCKLPIY